MAQKMSSAEGGGGGDTLLTKVFVGGLAWETHREGLRAYFERFGEILEAVVIFDRGTGRSKGFGFVTFREAEAAMRACLDPYPVIDGRRANCNLAYLGAHRSNARLSPYLPAAGHVHGGGNINTRAMKAAATEAGGGASFVDYGIQQGIPDYNMYGYPPNFWDYSYQPMNYYHAYGGLDGGAQYQVPMAGLPIADPTGFYNPYYPYFPVSPNNAAYNMMQYPQMYPFAPPEGSPTTASGLHQFVGAVAFEPSNRGQAAGMEMSPPTPQYQNKLVSSKHVAAPDQKKPLISFKNAAAPDQKNSLVPSKTVVAPDPDQKSLPSKPVAAPDQKKPSVPSNPVAAPDQKKT